MRELGSLLDALAGLSWPARRPVGAGAAGMHPSRLRGMSAEFTEYRSYRQGDDPRRLDWKLLARTDRAYLRITDDHSIRTTVVVLDASASLAFPADSKAKWVQVSRLAVGLAAVARGEGDPVGLVVAREQGVLRIPPRSRRGVIGEFARELDAIVPSGSARLTGALEGMRPTWRLAIISDFLGDETDLLGRAARLMVEGVEVFAVHVVADEELAPRVEARLAADPENPDLKRVMHEGVQGEYTAAFAAWRSALSQRWRLAGAEFTEVKTGDDTAGAVRRIVRGA